MRTALAELRRRPGRFLPVLATLTVLTTLLLLLGGLLDGLYLGSSSALRAQPGQLVVYSEGAREQLDRSRVDAEVREQVEAADGVADVGGFGLISTRIDGEQPLSVAVLGFESAPEAFSGIDLDEGQAIADDQLQLEGHSVGDRVSFDSDAPEVEIVAFVDDVGYGLQPALWTTPDTWREISAAARPDAQVPEGVFNVLIVRTDGDLEQVADGIDDATGTTQTLTIDEAILAIPGLEQQNTVFSGLIGATFGVAGIVVALFAALIVVERTALYGVLKALGTPSRRLLAGLLVQSITLAALAFVAGGLITLLLTVVIPETVPLRLEPSRALSTVALLLGTTALGSALTLRRVVRIEPASAIGGA